MANLEILTKHSKKANKCPYYSKKSSDAWFDNHTIRAILKLGDLSRPVPKCTIAISTYKRPNLLVRAVMSALDQEGFDDYEIVIGDNEGASLAVETQTQKALEEVADEKIFYFRYESSISGSRANALADLVRTEYFLILHDDDVLNRYTLKLMMKAIENNPSIDALCVKHQNLNNDESQSIADFMMAKHEKVLCRSVDFDETIFIHKNEHTGVMYRTKAYRESGGLHEEELGCGDVIFASEFNYFYNRYYLEDSFYGVTFHKRQLSATSDDWYPSFITKYFWNKAAMDIRKRDGFSLMKETMVRAYFFRTIKISNDSYKYYYGSDWGVDQDVISDCVGIPRFKKNQRIKRNIYKVAILLWERHIKRISHKREKEGFVIIA